MIYVEDHEENYTRDGHKKVSKRCREDGMFCVIGVLNNNSRRWLLDNEVFDVIPCSFLDQIWFDKESDAMAFKLTWMMD